MRGSRDKRRLGVAAASAVGLAVALAAVCSAVALARPLSFLHVRVNLSQTPVFVSAYPDLATTPDGERVVVAWTEAYTGTVATRGHVYARFASETGTGWTNRVAVFSGGKSDYGDYVTEYAYDAALAVSDDAVHVAYLVAGFSSNGSLVGMDVRYQECHLDLSMISCDDTEHVVASVDWPSDKITWVDVALDDGGNPHVVWAQYDATGLGDVWYRARGNETWGAKLPIAQTGDNGKPAIAWADGYAHVVWEEETTHRIAYWRHAASGGTGTVYLCPSQPTSPPGNPDIAARDGRVFVVWNQCASLEGSLCRQYHLPYRRSNDNGATWMSIREVGTDRSSLTEVYYSFDVISETISSEMGEYGLDLQPSIALNSDGWPVVGWHAEGHGASQGVYGIYYSYSETGTADGVDWDVRPSASLVKGLVGSAVIAAGQGDSDRPLHIGYMRRVGGSAWEVWYGSNQEDRYYYRHMPVAMRND